MEGKRNSRWNLPIGYADGYLTGIGDSAYVLVEGVKAKVIGRVSMDLTAVALVIVKIQTMTLKLYYGEII